jgi:hypothetical protein
MDPRGEFFRDMVEAFKDLPPEAFSEFRSAAAELGVPVENIVRGCLPRLPAGKEAAAEVTSAEEGVVFYSQLAS